jgi:hypothetical protein
MIFTRRESSSALKTIRDPSRIIRKRSESSATRRRLFTAAKTTIREGSGIILGG